MKSRRQFIKHLSAGIALPGFLGVAEAQAFTEIRINSSLKDGPYWDSIRALFPLTKNRVYFNNGTFGPAPTPVQEAMEDSLRHINTSGEYGTTEPEREKLAAFLGIKPSELSLTHNTTEGINIMAWGLALKPGDEVILTTHDHVGNALPWLNRAKLHGIVLKTFSPKDTQEKNLELIKSLVSPRTKVIAIPHVTCTAGHVFPIKEISAFARSRGVMTAIDGAHGAGSLDLDLHDLGCDFYAGCCHKWLLGPSGTAFLFVREEMLDQLQPYHIGGGSDAGWDLFSEPPLLQGYVPTAHRFDYGTQSTSLMKGVSAAAAFHLQIGKAKIEARIRELNQYAYNGLVQFKDQIEILSPEESISRISMVTFRPKKITYQEAGKRLAESGFRIRQVPEGNLNAIRISTHIYNSKEELDQLFVAMPQALS